MKSTNLNVTLNCLKGWSRLSLFLYVNKEYFCELCLLPLVLLNILQIENKSPKRNVKKIKRNKSFKRPD